MSNKKDQTPQSVALQTPSEMMLTASKRDIKSAAQSAILNVTPEAALVMAKRLNAFSTEVISLVKETLSNQLGEGEKISALGAKVYFKGGGFAFRSPGSYEHDPVWQQLKADIEAREELMRAAAKMLPGMSIYDESGAEVPRAIEQQVSPALMCNF